MNGVWDSFLWGILSTARVIHPSIKNEWCMGFLPLKHSQYGWGYSFQYLEWMVFGIPFSKAFSVLPEYTSQYLQRMMYGIPSPKAFSILPGLFILVLRMNGVWNSFLWGIFSTDGIIYPSIESEYCRGFFPLRYFQYWVDNSSQYFLCHSLNTLKKASRVF